MIVVIAGSREYTYAFRLEKAIADSGFEITEVVSGCARGVDHMGEVWAAKHGIPITKFPADWDKHGKAAGPIRNEQMSEYADALILLMYPDSRGSANMLKCMQKLNKPYHVELLSYE
jgi:hypothetical protein